MLNPESPGAISVLARSYSRVRVCGCAVAITCARVSTCACDDVRKSYILRRREWKRVGFSRWCSARRWVHSVTFRGGTRITEVEVAEEDI